jgi:hypothetical protein
MSLSPVSLATGLLPNGAVLVPFNLDVVRPGSTLVVRKEGARLYGMVRIGANAWSTWSSPLTVGEVITCVAVEGERLQVSSARSQEAGAQRCVVITDSASLAELSPGLFDVSN